MSESIRKSKLWNKPIKSTMTNKEWFKYKKNK